MISASSASAMQTMADRRPRAAVSAMVGNNVGWLFGSAAQRGLYYLKAARQKLRDADLPRHQVGLGVH
eukprot:6060682-Amphidinium_carterae.1